MQPYMKERRIRHTCDTIEEDETGNLGREPSTKPVRPALGGPP